MKSSYTLAEATKKLERYCAYQERCHQEVISKLKEMGMIPEAVDEIVAYLIEENYLNEERFARAFARGKFRIKKWGRNRIMNELKKRNISKYNISVALSEINDTEYLKAFDMLAKKRRAEITEKNPTKIKRKLADYLLYRGWESQMVYDKVSRLVK